MADDQIRTTGRREADISTVESMIDLGVDLIERGLFKAGSAYLRAASAKACVNGWARRESSRGRE